MLASISNEDGKQIHRKNIYFSNQGEVWLSILKEIHLGWWVVHFGRNILTHTCYPISKKINIKGLDEGIKNNSWEWDEEILFQQDIKRESRKGR